MHEQMNECMAKWQGHRSEASCMELLQTKAVVDEQHKTKVPFSTGRASVPVNTPVRAPVTGVPAGGAVLVAGLDGLLLGLGDFFHLFSIHRNLTLLGHFWGGFSSSNCCFSFFGGLLFFCSSS